MQTVSVDLTANLTSDEVTELTRRRRELENTLEDRRQDAGRLRAKLSALGNSLEDPAILGHIQQLQKQLAKSQAACAAADEALAGFQASNPTPEQIEQLERERAIKTNAKLHNEAVAQFSGHVHAAARLLIKVQEKLSLARQLTEDQETRSYFADAVGMLPWGTQACATLLEPSNWRACQETGLDQFLAKSLPKAKRV